jgi:hypothetical protein
MAVLGEGLEQSELWDVRPGLQHDENGSLQARLQLPPLQRIPFRLPLVREGGRESSLIIFLNVC